MTDERCKYCDGPTKTAPSGVIRVCASADLAHNCTGEPVDWRARALAAEAENVRLVGCAVFAESVRDECEGNEHYFNTRGGQHVGRTPGMTAGENSRLLRHARYALDGSQGKYSYVHWLFTNRRADHAESIARRALVEGLKECERLRALLLKAFPPDRYIDGEPYWFVGGFRLRIRDGHPFATLDEQAIRADERAKIVAWLRDAYWVYFISGNADGGTTMGDICEAIERGEHTAALRGGKGE